MSVWKLVVRELRHRRLNFVLTLVSVAAALAGLTGAQSLLQGDQLLTAGLLESKRQEVEAAVARREDEVRKAGKELEDAIRKQMLKLGFNVLIVPESQDLSELHLNGMLTETMPEDYVRRLAESRIVTVNHLLPSVMKRVSISQNGQSLDVIVQGTRGEVPIMHRAMKKMLLEAVPPGKAVVGAHVARRFGLKPGDTLTIQSREFSVSTVHPERGSTDDVTVWIDLKQAQDLFGLQNLVHAILALECECAGDRITEIRQEIQSILPGTQVVERYSQALTRAESRARAKQTAQQALEREKRAGAEALAQEQATRMQIEQRHADLTTVLVPLVMLGAAVWIGLLTFLNVRQRRSEIGMLRAIGLSTRPILSMILARAVITGCVGGLIGAALGVVIGALSSGLPQPLLTTLLESRDVLLMLALSPLLAPAFAALASWLPAQWAVRQDPASILQAD